MGFCEKSRALVYSPSLMTVYRAFERIPKHYRVAAGAAVLIIAGVVSLYYGTAKVVSVSVDGEIHRIRSHARSVSAVLRSVRLDYAPEDLVIPDGETKIDNGGAIRVVRAGHVALDVDSQSTSILTAAIAPADILAEAGFDLYPGDRVWIDGIRMSDPASLPMSRPNHIRVARAISVSLEVNGVLQQIRSAAPTLGEALWEAGITLRVGDRLVPDASTPLAEVVTAKLDFARSIAIQVDGLEIETIAAGPLVGDALAQVGVTLVGLDYTRPQVNDPLPSNGRIQVVRVIEEVLVEMEPLPFKTVYQPAPEIELDAIEVLDSGTYGVLANRIRIRSENGVEIERVVEDAWEAVDPSPRILGYGTKIVVRTMNTPYGVIEYWRAVPVYQTSYSPCNLGVGYCGEITASGKKLSYGMIGVIRSWFNMMRGWPVYVPNYGPATIEDIGAGIAGKHWIDLAYSDEEYVVRYGWTTLYFLTPVPPLDQIPWILP